MEDSGNLSNLIQTIVNFGLGGLGFLAVIAVMILPFVGLGLFIVSMVTKDEKKARRFEKWAIGLAGGPMALIIFVLITFTVANSLLN